MNQPAESPRPLLNRHTAEQVAAFIASRPADDAERQEAEQQVLEAAAKRIDDEARALFSFLQGLDRAAAVRIGLESLQN